MPGEFSSTPFPTFATTTLPARSFDGSSQFVNMGNGSPLNITAGATFSMSIWANMANSAGGQQTIFGKGFDSTPNTTCYFFQINAGVISIGSYNGAVSGVSPTWTFGNNSWHNLYGDFDGTSTWRLYVDGTLIGSGNTGTRGPENNTRSVFAGAADTNSGTVQRFSGCLADAAIYNGRLTGTEIANLANGSLRPNTGMSQTLLGYWFLNGTSSPEPDQTSNGNNGTVTGTNPSVCASGPP
jgi:Concanavalin A-like lectin/glucanases superfamily